MNLIEVKPDDMLVLRVPDRLHKGQHDSALAALRSIFGYSQKILILDGGQEIDVIRSALPVEAKEVADALGTPGIGGRDVVHVSDAAEAESALPDAVWMSFAGLQPHQRNLVSNVRTNDHGETEYFIQTMFLDDAQKAQAVRNG